MTDVERSNFSLAVGGTGMLADATRWLADRSSTTLLVARNASRFCTDDTRFASVDLDWTSWAFRDELTRTLSEAPPVARALLWLHTPESALPWLLPLLPGAFVVLVLGSMNGRPRIPDDAADLVTLRLGSKPASNGGRRWLTDREISDGAILAFTSGRSQIVGELLQI